MISCIEYRASVQLYNDGELGEEERSELLRHLDLCWFCQNALQEEEALSARVRAARPRISAPESLRSTVERRLRETSRAVAPPAPVRRPVSSRVLTRSLLATAAASILVAAAALTLKAPQRREDARIIEAAVVAHSELQQHAVSLDVVSDSPEAVTSWFQSRVSFPFQMADAGIASNAMAHYKLDGGRLVAVGKDRLALVSFHLPHEVVSMLVTPGRLLTASGGKVVDSGGIAFHSHDEESTHVVTWNNRGLGYVLAAETSMTRNCTNCHQASPAQESAANGSPLGAGSWGTGSESALAIAESLAAIASPQNEPVPSPSPNHPAAGLPPHPAR